MGWVCKADSAWTEAAVTCTQHQTEVPVRADFCLSPSATVEARYRKEINKEAGWSRWNTMVTQWHQQCNQLTANRFHTASHSQSQFPSLLLPAPTPRHLPSSHLHRSHSQASSCLWAHLHILSTAKLSGDEEGEASGETS